MSMVIDKVANKKKNLHKFLTTAYNPQRRQHFQVRKYLKEGKTEAAVEYDQHSQWPAPKATAKVWEEVGPKRTDMFCP